MFQYSCLAPEFDALQDDSGQAKGLMLASGTVCFPKKQLVSFISETKRLIQGQRMESEKVVSMNSKTKGEGKRAFKR